MSHREKIAWLSLLAMAFAYGPYFAFAARRPVSWEPWPHLHPLALFAFASLVRMLILGAGYLYFRLALPRHERPPLDERDRAIERLDAGFDQSRCLRDAAFEAPQKRCQRADRRGAEVWHVAADISGDPPDPDEGP